MKGEMRKGELSRKGMLQATMNGEPLAREHLKSLGLKKNEDGIYVCHRRMQGEELVFLQSFTLYTEKEIAYAHHTTLCGGIGLTMAKLRYIFWVPRLGRMTKKVTKSCHACKRFHARPYNPPNPGFLSKTRTEGNRPFEVVGVDPACLIKYIAKKEDRRKDLYVNFCLQLYT